MTHRQPSTPLTLVAAATAVAIAACGGPAEVGDAPDTGTDEIQGDWELTDGSGPEGPLPLVDGHPVTLSVEDQQLGGTAACNSYGGQLTGEPGELEIGQLVQTEMACMPDEVMASEAAYLDALAAVDHASRDGDGLVLTGPDIELRFEPIFDGDSAR